MIRLGDKKTLSTVADRLARCHDHNAAERTENEEPCPAITYYAHLTESANDQWAGNCSMRTARGHARFSDKVNPDLTLSAHMTCLDKNG